LVFDSFGGSGGYSLYLCARLIQFGVKIWSRVMRIGLPHNTMNVIRFPIERRARPTLELLREIAPDSREVALVIEEISIDCDLHEVRHTADRAMAEHILNHVPREHGPARRTALQSLLEPLVTRAIEACRRSNDAIVAATAAQDAVTRAKAESGYWMAPLAARAAWRAQEAARLLVEAHVAAEEAEGAARAIDLASRGEEWRPFDVNVEAAALFGFERRAG
jgi:hypothetical protein